jgi:O-antigen/teichoic acid export membrane protein
MLFSRLETKVATDIIFYTATTFVQKTSPFIVMNLAALELSSSEIGLYSYILLIINFVQPFLGLELHRSIEFYFFKDKSKNNLFSSVLSTLFAFMLVSSIFAIILDSSFRIIDNLWTTMLPVYIFANIVYEIVLTNFRNIGDRKRYLIYNIGFTGVYMSLFLYFLTNDMMEKTWLTMFIPLWITTIMFGIISLYYLRHSYELRLCFSGVKKYIRFSLPFLLFLISSFIANNVDKYFAEKYLGMESLGILAMALAYSSVIKFFSNAFMKSYTPIYFGTSQEHVNESKIYQKYFGWVIVTLTVLSSGALMLIFALVLPDDYDEGIWLIPIISIAYLVRGFRQMFIPVIMKAEKTKYIGFEVVIIFVFGSSMAILLVKNFGLIGAAISLVWIQAISLLYYRFLNRYIINKD